MPPRQTVLLTDTLRQALQTHGAELIGRYVPLRRQGKQLMGRCPFHPDTHPSFSVCPERGLYHCLGCDAGGDVLRFLMQLKGLRFTDAVRDAAQTLGLALPADPPSSAAHTALWAAAETATALFEAWLWGSEGATARAYLAQRGIDRKTARTFRLGYQPDHAARLVEALGMHQIALEHARTLGLVVEKERQWRSVMRGRVLFPIQDCQGRVCGFGARTLSTRRPKYLNSPTSAIFQKGHLLYGWPQARHALSTHKTALVVEGYLDVLALHQAGLLHVVSPLSTTLTSSHFALLRTAVSQATLLFDGDLGGQQGALRTLGLAAGFSLPVSVATLPGGTDPDSYLRTHGCAALQEILARSCPLDRYVIEWLATHQDREAAARAILMLAEPFTDRVLQIRFLQRAEQRLALPGGSLTEAVGIGHTARQRLERVLADLIIHVPAVRQRLRGTRIPLQDVQLRRRVAQLLGLPVAERPHALSGGRAEPQSRAQLAARRQAGTPSRA